MTRVLITGIAGFVGTHLVRYLLANGDRLSGFDRIRPASLPLEIGFYPGDIRDRDAVKQVMLEVRPDIVYHLAGALKATNPEELYTVNVLGTVALFEAIFEAGLKPTVLVTSSSAVYGQGSARRRVTEKSALRPVTHYGVSKIAQEVVALRYHRAQQLPVMCTRAFNFIGPAQPPQLACSAFARQIALAEHTRSTDTIVTGNLRACRDFVDVRDGVRAFALVARLGKPGSVYNICSGKAVTIRHCLNLLLQMSDLPLKTQVDLDRVQADDVPAQIGSAARLYRQSRWKPAIGLRQSLADLLDYWRTEARSQTVG